MKAAKRKSLEKAGWRVGTVAEFLGLSAEEASLVEMKLSLARSIKARRLKHRLSQAALAKRIGSSQSRVAKMEIADGSVSLDLLVRALLALGASRAEVGKVLASKTAHVA